MGLLDNLAGPVGKLLTTFGTSVTYRPNEEETYSPSEGANVTTPASYTLKALVEEWADRDTRGGASSEGGTVRGDKRVTIAATEFTRTSAATPTTNADLTIGSLTYRVTKVDQQLGTDSPLLYVMRCSR